MRGTTEDDSTVHARLEIPVSELGLQAPPADCHLRAMAVNDVWVVYLWGPADRGPLLDWIQDHGSFRPREGPGMDRVLAVQAAALPRPLTRLFEGAKVLTLILRTDGRSEVELRAPREHLGALVDEVDGKIVQLVDAPSAPEQEGQDPLTDGEREALLAAYEAGYFDVPRSVRLEDLSQQMDKSIGSLSTLIRRAVLELVESYATGTPVDSPEIHPSPADVDEEKAPRKAPSASGEPAD